MRIHIRYHIIDNSCHSYRYLILCKWNDFTDCFSDVKNVWSGHDGERQTSSAVASAVCLQVGRVADSVAGASFCRGCVMLTLPPPPPRLLCQAGANNN